MGSLYFVSLDIATEESYRFIFLLRGKRIELMIVTIRCMSSFTPFFFLVLISLALASLIFLASLSGTRVHTCSDTHDLGHKFHLDPSYRDL